MYLIETGAIGVSFKASSRMDECQYLQDNTQLEGKC